MFEKREYVRMREEHSILANSFPKIRYFRRRRYPEVLYPLFVTVDGVVPVFEREARVKCLSKSKCILSVKFRVIFLHGAVSDMSIL